MSFNYSINEPLLAQEPRDRTNSQLNTKHIYVPNVENLRNSVVYVTSSDLNIWSSPTKSKAKHATVVCDTIILIRNAENVSKHVEVLLPIPGWIERSQMTESMIRIDEHHSVIGNTQELWRRFAEKERNENRCIQGIKQYFRKRPRLLHFLVLLIFGFLECFVVIDIYFDVQVAIELYKAHQPIWFSIACVLITAPYYVAWAVMFQFIRNKVFLSSFKNKKCRQFMYQGVLFPVFLFSPLGLAILILYDFYHTFECAILKPLWFGCTGRKLRTESYHEQGYKKLRSVSEIFAETICQSLFNAWILYRVKGDAFRTDALNIDLNKVLMSFGSSLFSLCVYGVILYYEANKYGLSVIEYLCVVMTGSFNFVPYLPAIERGRENGESVNWIYYKLTNYNIGNIGMAFNSRRARCDRIKVSDYTISKMHRRSAVFFGQILNANDVEIIYSWRESHIKDWFAIFDVDESGAFEFEEFARLMVCMYCVNQLYSYHAAKQNNAPQLIYSYNYDMDVVSIHEFIGLFNILASKERKQNVFCIWMLDILLMVQQSKEWLPVLDQYKPLNYAVRTDNIVLMTLLASYDYQSKAIENEIEFEKAVKEAVVYQKYKLSMTLCEPQGVPIVIHIDRVKDCRSLWSRYGVKGDMCSVYITVSCINCLQYRSRELRFDEHSLIWDDYVLFIIPFQAVDRMRKRKHNALEFRISYRNEEEAAAVFLDRISINLNEYEQIYKKQGWFNTLRDQKEVHNNYNTFEMSQSMDSEEEHENDIERLIFDEARYNIVITDDDDDESIFLSYTVYLGALNIYETFGLKYIDSDIHELEALQSIEEMDKFGEGVGDYQIMQSEVEFTQPMEEKPIVKYKM
eukprot:243497_1